MESFKVVIAGGRLFLDYELMVTTMDRLLNRKVAEGYDIEVISGTAKGADTMGERYAEQRGFKLVRMPAQWSTHGRSAGYKRNVAMANIADAVVLFWDGKSTGTKHMYAISVNLPTRVIKY
tara:strand:- start:180 stop:542 length:363 start_codon:yes stop_codon:yes gene_type:complete